MSVGSGWFPHRKTLRLPHHEKNGNAFSIGLRNNSGFFSLRGVRAGRMRQGCANATFCPLTSTLVRGVCLIESRCSHRALPVEVGPGSVTSPADVE